MGSITAGSASIHDGLCCGLNAHGFAPHGTRRTGQFLKGFSFGGQGCHQCSDLDVGYIAGKNFSYHLRHFVCA